MKTAAKVAKGKSAPRLTVATAQNEHAHEYTYLYTKTMHARKYTTYIHNIGL